MGMEGDVKVVFAGSRAKRSVHLRLFDCDSIESLFCHVGLEVREVISRQLFRVRGGAAELLLHDGENPVPLHGMERVFASIAKIFAILVDANSLAVVVLVFVVALERLDNERLLDTQIDRLDVLSLAFSELARDLWLVCEIVTKRRCTGGCRPAERVVTELVKQSVRPVIHHLRRSVFVDDMAPLVPLLERGRLGVVDLTRRISRELHRPDLIQRPTELADRTTHMPAPISKRRAVVAVCRRAQKARVPVAEGQLVPVPCDVADDVPLPAPNYSPA